VADFVTAVLTLNWLEQITFRRNRFAMPPEGVNLLYLVDVEPI